jgi:hypothetical protein
MKWRIQWIFAPAVLLGLAAPTANASIITYSTPSGSTADGLPASASATFTTSANTITVVLRNLQADPKSVIQNLSELFFTLNTRQNSGSLTSSNATERTVNGDATFSDGGSVSTGWILSTSGLGFLLNDLAGPGHAGPAHTIIGPPNMGMGLYTSAKGSIAGNKPQNPFLNQFATFAINAPGVTANSLVDSATFSFGSDGDTFVPGVSGLVPEPGSLALVGIGLGSASVFALRLRRAKPLS